VPEGLPGVASELNIPVGHNSLRQIVQLDTAVEKDLGYSRGVRGMSKAGSGPF